MTDGPEKVLALVSGLREPTELGREVRQQLQEAYARRYAEREAQGGVQTAEDTFAMQRSLAGVRELFEGYARVFKEGAKLTGQLQQEELVEAVGEQKGKPNQGMTVPSSEGDIVLKLDHTNSHDIDVDQLVAVLALEAMDRLGQSTGVPTPAHLEEHLVAMVTFVCEVMASWGSFAPQVSKVRAYAAELARAGQDKRAAQVTGAIVTTKTYKGVGFERKTPK